MKHSGKILVLLLAIFMLPETSWGEGSAGSFWSTYLKRAGITFSLIDFDVYNKGSTNTNGTLSEDFSLSPFVTLASPYTFFGNSNWGWFMEYSLSSFRLNQQLIDIELVDLGTSVKGYYAFVTPILFYSFSGRDTSRKHGKTIIVGLGAGIGYLSATGDIIFTETTQQRIDFDVSGRAEAVLLYFDYRKGNFVTRLNTGLTGLTEGNFDYDASSFSLSFGYNFDF